MDDEMILESLDSLWFFSSILSLYSPITCINEKNMHDANLSCDPCKPKQAAPPTAQILQPQQLKSPDTCAQAVGDGTGPEEQATEPENYETSKCLKESNMERRKKKSNREQGMKKLHRFNEFTDLGLSFGELESDGGPFYTFWEQQRMARSSGLREIFRCYDMPPLSDGLAMKEHLKSWAHAVACTAR